MAQSTVPPGAPKSAPQVTGPRPFLDLTTQPQVTGPRPILDPMPQPASTGRRYASSQVSTMRRAPPENAKFEVITRYDELPTTCHVRDPAAQARMDPSRGIPMDVVICPERIQSRDIGEFQVQSAYHRGDYARLDALWSKWCTGQPRFADGRWVLGAFRQGLQWSFENTRDYEDHQRRIQDWLIARPGSEAARFAMAVHGNNWAWQARGSGYSNEVSKEAWMLFGKRMEPALKTIYDMVMGEPSCAAPYQLALHMFATVSAPKPLLEKVYEAGASRFPGFHEIHLAMARSLEPRWGGSVDAYHAFVDRVVERTRSIEGTAMYPRLFAPVDFGEMAFKPGTRGSPDEKRMRAGLDDLVKRNPDSALVASMAAGFLCRTADSAGYRRERARFVGQEADFPLVDGTDACDRRHGWGGAAPAPLTPVKSRR